MNQEAKNTVTMTASELEWIAYAIRKASPAARGKMLDTLSRQVAYNPEMSGLVQLLNIINRELSIAEDMKEYSANRSGYRNPATRKYRGI